jgi:catechol 2,3-dioxygenase-like lactoylglutathione lyase family enzyme
VANNPVSHIDLRVRSFESVGNFYRQILPAIGFTEDRSGEGWIGFYSDGAFPSRAFFGLSEDPQHLVNGTRIAFWAESRKEVDRIGGIVIQAGAINVEGPDLNPEYGDGYYAIFFEDPEGNKYEVVCREEGKPD